MPQVLLNFLSNYLPLVSVIILQLLVSIYMKHGTNEMNESFFFSPKNTKLQNCKLPLHFITGWIPFESCLETAIFSQYMFYEIYAKMYKHVARKKCIQPQANIKKRNLFLGLYYFPNIWLQYILICDLSVCIPLLTNSVKLLQF